MQTTYIFLHEVRHPRSKGAGGLRRIIRTPFRLGKPGPDEVLCLLLLYVVKGRCQPLCTSVGVLLIPFGPRGSITAGAEMVGTNVRDLISLPFLVLSLRKAELHLALNTL